MIPKHEIERIEFLLEKGMLPVSFDEHECELLLQLITEWKQFKKDEQQRRKPLLP